MMQSVQMTRRSTGIRAFIELRFRKLYGKSVKLGDPVVAHQGNDCRTIHSARQEGAEGHVAVEPLACGVGQQFVEAFHRCIVVAIPAVVEKTVRKVPIWTTAPAAVPPGSDMRRR